MHRAVYSTVALCAWVHISIIENEEIGLIGISNIEVYVRVFQILLILLNRYEKLPIISLYVTSLLSEFFCPLVIRVTVGSIEGLLAPWVAQDEQPVTVRKLLGVLD